MKNENLTWDGIYPAILTPFDKDGAIDYDMFKKSLETQYDAGCAGFVIAGSLGETSTLTNEEKFALVKFAKKVLPKAPILVNVAESKTTWAIDFAIKAKEIGADGIMLLPPLLYKASDHEVVEYFKEVASATDLPILIYNNPVDYGIHVTVEMFEELEDCPTIEAVKESTRDLTNVTRMINRFGDRFKILGGVDTIALETQLLGGSGSIAGLVNAFPYETVAYFKLAEAGRLKEALEIYRWFMPLLELDIVPKLVQYIKLAATAEGLSNPFVRAPRLQIEGKELERVQKIIEEGIKTRPDLKQFSPEAK